MDGFATAELVMDEFLERLSRAFPGAKFHMVEDQKNPCCIFFTDDGMRFRVEWLNREKDQLGAMLPRGPWDGREIDGKTVFPHWPGRDD
jgi:hypothetical protein